jgi:hypothetical protein
MGKRFKVMPEQFAGPVALCCTLFCGGLVFLFYFLMSCSSS